MKLETRLPRMIGRVSRRRRAIGTGAEIAAQPLVVLGVTANKPMSDTMVAKGSVQRRCPSVTVTQDG